MELANGGGEGKKGAAAYGAENLAGLKVCGVCGESSAPLFLPWLLPFFDLTQPYYIAHPKSVGYILSLLSFSLRLSPALVLKIPVKYLTIALVTRCC